MSEVKTVRLNKRLAELGYCSRREADEWIARGLVLVNGVIVTQLGTQVGPNDVVTVADQAVEEKEAELTILLNKPIGYVSSQPEKGYEEASVLITAGNQWLGDDRTGRAARIPASDLHGFSPVGRLDIESKGLMIFTQDGRVAKQIIGPDSEMEKEYIVRVEGEINRGKINKLCFGLSLDGEKLKPAKVFEMEPGLLNFVLTQGKNRQIRRMCEQMDLQVVHLKRVRVGNVRLGALPEGKWRVLMPDEFF